jgi:hypothetical protein
MTTTTEKQYVKTLVTLEILSEESIPERPADAGVLGDPRCSRVAPPRITRPAEAAVRLHQPGVFRLVGCVRHPPG